MASLTNRTLGAEELPDTDDPYGEFVQSVRNNQPNRALTYAIALFDRQEKRINELESELAAVRKPATKKATSRSKTSSAKDDAEES